MSQGDRWTARPCHAARRLATGAVLACLVVPFCADAQRALPRESGGRGKIVSYEEAANAHIVYHEESGGMSTRAPSQPVPAREEASTKAPRAGSVSTAAAADAPVRRAAPRRVAAASDPRVERP